MIDFKFVLTVCGLAIQFKENTGNTKSAKRIKEKALSLVYIRVYMRRNNTSFRPTG